MSKYPRVKNPDLVGTYSALTKSGGGYVWDDVLEYRVWCHPEMGAPDLYDGEDYYYCFDNFEDALEFSKATKGAEEPLALILQEEYIDEPEPGRYIHKKGPRITEWNVEWLDSPRREANTIPEFISKGTP
jgi:putative acetyltransferase